MTNSQRKQLQDIQTDKNWEVVEEYIAEYIEQHLQLQNSVKRNDSFNTIWDRAFTEGGEFHIKKFFNSIEAEARRYDINGV
jgi:hypothetical protein